MFAFALLTLALSPFLISTPSALRVTPNSPCLDRCGDDTSNTTTDEIACRDTQISDSPVGSKFQDCVECELESEHFITDSGESDVEWGLYNLRFAFSVCIFGVPAQKQSLSTPCQVNCEDLHDSIVYHLQDPSGFTAYDFCGLSSFPDDVVTKCADCYALTEDEKFQGNFVEALREGCRSKVPRGSPFILDPTRIFDKEQIPPNTESIAAKGSGGGGDGKPDNLVLIIVLPIIGFLILVACLGVGCFFLVRHRRRKAKRNSQSDHLHERWNDTSIMTPMPPGMGKAFDGDEQQLQQQQQQQQQQEYSLPNSPHSFGAHSQNLGQNFYQPEYPQQGDVRYPSAAYVMDEHPSSPVVDHQQQYQPVQFQYLQQQDQHHQHQQQQQQQQQQASVPTQQTTNVPVLSDPPPPRKSLTASKTGEEQ